MHGQTSQNGFLPLPLFPPVPLSVKVVFHLNLYSGRTPAWRNDAERRIVNLLLVHIDEHEQQRWSRLVDLRFFLEKRRAQNSLWSGRVPVDGVAQVVTPCFGEPQ